MNDQIKRPPIDPGQMMEVSMENTMWLMKWCQHLEAENAELMEALIWSSGARDFSPEGECRKGWKKLCKPLLDRFLDKSRERR